MPTSLIAVKLFVPPTLMKVSRVGMPDRFGDEELLA
jgi:hypothetical protein